MAIAQRSSFVQNQRLGLKLSPQLLQSVRIMTLPIADLRLQIDEELQKNPALELITDRSTVSLDARRGTGDVFRAGGAKDGELHRAFIEGALSRPETLQEHLLRQFHLEPLPTEAREAGELIIQNLSPDGFHTESLELLLKSLAPEDVQRALEAVRRLDPQGCGTADYQESLAVQAELRYDAQTREKIAALFPYFAEYERGKLLAIKRKTGMSEAELRALFEKLKRLSPFPGRQFVSGGGSVSETRFVIPDVSVIRKENKKNEFKIVINDEEIPVLGISPFFLKNAPAESGGRDFIRENVQEARWFINSLNKRNRTVFRVSRAIVHYQKDFFVRGPKYLVPLTQRKIAEKLEMHETTVSRAANGKYMETEWGTFEIRYFFSNAAGAAQQGGGVSEKRFSKTGVKEIIREILSGEAHLLSDNQIAERLGERGIRIARRTVAKYRAELERGSSFRR
ncbi:MAG: RNA polymerase factor sigma-54 [Spirochaetaceae bacterium]|nr:RNA polymerase factor sigma-54 [Spirochaetaceae bacterium]